MGVRVSTTWVTSFKTGRRKRKKEGSQAGKGEAGTSGRNFSEEVDRAPVRKRRRLKKDLMRSTLAV